MLTLRFAIVAMMICLNQVQAQTSEQLPHGIYIYLYNDASGNGATFYYDHLAPSDYARHNFVSYLKSSNDEMDVVRYSIKFIGKDNDRVRYFESVASDLFSTVKARVGQYKRGGHKKFYEEFQGPNSDAIYVMSETVWKDFSRSRDLDTLNFTRMNPDEKCLSGNNYCFIPSLKVR